MNLRTKYNMQKTHASIRGIDWQFTYQQWLDWWGDDIELRGGRHKDDLVMARYNDVGPYHPDNVYKTTLSKNIVEYQDRIVKSVVYKGKHYRTLSDLAKELGVHGKTVRRHIEQGKLEAEYV